MTIDLIMPHLSDGERLVIKNLEAHVRKVHHRELAPYLFDQLQIGRAYVLDINSVEFKGLTKWQ